MRAAISMLLYGVCIVAAFYSVGNLISYTIILGVIVLIQVIGALFLMGYLRGNAIKVSQKQFPVIYEIVKAQAEKLQLTSIPEVYLLQQGGILNAFVTRFLSRHYIILFSNVLAEAYKESDR